ncbi:MAG: FAD-dependent oxidoreductase [Anaerolineae bacterium]
MARFTYDAVVVGAGPAGVSAGMTMARQGLKVIVIERGRFAGAKNLSGGTLYTHALLELLPDLWDRDPPLERPVTEHGFWFLSKGAVTRLTHRSEELEPVSHTVLRARFDPWFAEQASEVGALLIGKTTVTDFLRGGRGEIVGIITDRAEGDVYAPMVIVAEGVNNLLTQKLGLAKADLRPEYVALGVKEVIGLSEEEIEKRFGLWGPEEGLAVQIFGDATIGLPGAAFLYTNRKSVSLGVAVILEDLVLHQLRPYEVLERFKNHRLMRPYLQGGKSLEYGAHLIPEWGYDHLPALAGDGVLVAGDAAGFVVSLQGGSNMAMISGKLAGEVAVEAHRQGNFSAEFLAHYRSRLEKSFILQDLKKYRRLTDFLNENPRFVTTYTDFLNEALGRYLAAPGVPMREVQRDIIRALHKRRSWPGVTRDLLSFARAMFL